MDWPTAPEQTDVPRRMGRYVLDQRLAAGGMAEVCLARMVGPGGFEKRLVVKRMLPELALQPHFVEMFLAEAKLAARFEHPNVVQVFDFGVAEGRYFLAMECIDGPTLRKVIRRTYGEGLQLPVALCARIASLVAQGLSYVHGFEEPATGEHLGLVHRDVSADNVLISKTGAVKLVDFGIAKAVNLSDRTLDGQLKGKFAYMAPEQLQGAPIDHRVDIFALGILLFELLTGKRPYMRSREAILKHGWQGEPPRRVREFRPDVPASLEALVMRAVAPDAERRFPQCRALANELDACILALGERVETADIAALAGEVEGSDAGPVTEVGDPSLSTEELVGSNSGATVTDALESEFSGAPSKARMRARRLRRNAVLRPGDVALLGGLFCALVCLWLIF